MSKFGIVSVLTIVGSVALVGYGLSSSEEEHHAKLAANIELECRGETSPSFGASEPAGYRSCIASRRANIGLD